MNAYNELIGIFAEIDDKDTMGRFFTEIFTEKEIRDLTLRWDLMKDLYLGETQRNIAAKHKISLCKITRGSRLLKKTGSVINELLEKTYGDKRKKQGVNE